IEAERPPADFFPTLLSVTAHEVGHLLGYEHAEGDRHDGPLAEVAFLSGTHDIITQTAQPFLKEDVERVLENEHRFQDGIIAGLPLLPPQFNQGFHFDGSHFQETGANINRWLGLALAEASPSTFYPDQVATWYGKVLHAVQDFYAHSNWPEL